ncbi:M24 family metallopeptidase [Spiroplasma endosymbiont of Panorpa germanica]|uniref:M24 family metallopeptidase n=1 Tax=Spiroplasma endosymbiont of Panorpa germanica TaxID=3066314 RepID=UPI003BAE5CBA
MDKKAIVHKIMEEKNVEAMLLYSPQNRYWFSRFNSSLGYILITKTKTYLFVDGRYLTAAQQKADLQNIDEIIGFGPVFDLINSKLLEEKISKVGFESDWVYVKDSEIMTQKIKAELISINTENLRITKDDWEVEQIQKACDITNQVFEDVLKNVKPGMSEKELARFVSDSFLKFGAEKLSFDTIVASGVNGSMPHAVPSDKKLQNGELVTLDMGCFYNGYASDQTRTFALGDKLDPKLLEIFQIVFDAQQAGIDAVKSGVEAKKIHEICFDYIDKKGYGKYFTHGTGHGLGIEIHEEPYQSVGGNKTLAPGHVITVEPGIYIPGLGGVRIEDDLLVTQAGYKKITTARRELIFVK